MSTVAYMLAYFVYILLAAEEFFLFIRAVMSFVAPESDGMIASFIYSVTEPLIGAVRKICDKLNISQNFPFDIPFFITISIVSILQIIFELFI